MATGLSGAPPVQSLPPLLPVCLTAAGGGRKGSRGQDLHPLIGPKPPHLRLHRLGCSTKAPAPCQPQVLHLEPRAQPPSRCRYREGSQLHRAHAACLLVQGQQSQGPVVGCPRTLAWAKEPPPPGCVWVVAGHLLVLRWGPFGAWRGERARQLGVQTGMCWSRSSPQLCLPAALSGNRRTLPHPLCCLNGPGMRALMWRRLAGARLERGKGGRPPCALWGVCVVSR